MARISLQGVAKTFGDHFAVRPLNLEIRDGEFFTLLGPSGCGKTTLLRMIAGLERVTAGSISINGDDVTEKLPKDRDIALVFQDYALYPHLSVRDNIAFPLQARKLPGSEIANHVDEVAARLQIGALLDRRPRQLSGGQQQRVALGRALVRSPRAFLMDEPLSNLDAKLRVDMRAELKRLQRDLGITTIYVTHDQDEAMGMSDRIAVMRDGIIQHCAPPLEIYRQPANAWVASFVGSPSMNILELYAASEEGRTLLYRGADTECGIRLGMQIPPGPLKLGVRPEHVHFFETPRPDTIAGVVDVVELAGDHFVITLMTSFGPLVAKIYDGHAPAVGQPVNVGFEASRLHLFEVGNGQRIGTALDMES